MPDLTLVPGGAREPLLRHLVGKVLRDERTAQERTLADVAEDARVSLPHLSEVERGRKEPSSEVLAAICAALDLTMSDLLQRSASIAQPVPSAVPGRAVPGSVAGGARSLSTRTTTTGVQLSLAA